MFLILSIVSSQLRTVMEKVVKDTFTCAHEWRKLFNFLRKHACTYRLRSSSNKLRKRSTNTQHQENITAERVLHLIVNTRAYQQHSAIRRAKHPERKLKIPLARLSFYPPPSRRASKMDLPPRGKGSAVENPHTPLSFSLFVPFRKARQYASRATFNS